MANEQNRGLPSYKGYEFQIEVTAWLAVYLLGQAGWTTLVVEPASEEDVQFDLVPTRGPEEALAEVAASTASTSFEIQVKLRTSSAWTAAKFATLLQHGKKRKSPLTALGESPSAKYLLITTWHVSSELGRHLVTSPTDSPQIDSFHPDVLAKLPADTSVHASRIGILVLSGRPEQDIKDLLPKFGVPPSRWTLCIAELKSAVRTRLLGKAERSWTKAEIEHVIKSHGGFLHTPRLPEPFVEPSCFAGMRRHLHQHNLLVITGPAGVGKSMAAEQLALEHQLETIPYEIVRNPASIAEITSRSDDGNPYLFVVVDPWGRERRDARGQHWKGDLRQLVPLVKQNLRVIVTSPLSVLADSPGIDGRVTRYAVEMNKSHYSRKARAEMLDEHTRQFCDWRLGWVEEHSFKITLRLELPLAISCFVRQLQQVPKAEEPSLEQLLSDSLIEAEAHRFVAELRAQDWMIPDTQVVTWAILTADLPVGWSMLDAIDDAWISRYAESLELRRAFEWLRDAGWWTPGPPSLGIRAERLVELAKIVDQSWARAKRTLSNALVVLASLAQFDLAVRLLEALSGRRMRMPDEATRLLEGHVARLIAELEGAPDSLGFRRALGKLRTVTWWDNPLVVMVLALENVRTKEHAKSDPAEEGFTADWFASWGWSPPDWTESQREMVMKSSAAEAIARRWVREVLPETGAQHYGEDLLQFFDGLGWDLSTDFQESLRHPSGLRRSDEIIVRGALHTSAPDFDGTLQFLLTAYEQESESLDRSRRTGMLWRAEQQQLDRAHSEHVFETSDDDASMVESALITWVSVWRAKQGEPWPGKPAPDLIVKRAWQKVLQQPDTRVSELELQELLVDSDGDLRTQALRTLYFSGFQGAEFRSAALRSLDPLRPDAETAAAIMVLWKWRDVDDLRGFLATVDVSHQVELVGQLHARWSDDSEATAAVDDITASLFSSIVTSAAAALRTPTDSAQPPDVELLRGIVEVRGSFRIPAIKLLTRSGVLLGSLTNELLSSSDAEERCLGLRELARHSEDLSAVRSAFKDVDWTCRKLAVEILAERSSAENDWVAIRALASDESWPVAKAVALAMASAPDRVDLRTTLSLLRNDNDQSADTAYGDGSPIHEVARAAAQVLAEFKPLPVDVEDELLDMVRRRQHTAQDPGVRKPIVRALMATRPRDLLALLEDDEDLSDMIIICLDLHPDLRPEIDVGRAVLRAGHENSWIGNIWAIVLGLLGDRTRQATHQAIRDRLYSPRRAAMIALSFLCEGRPLDVDTLAERMPPWPEFVQVFLLDSKLTAATWLVRRLRSRDDSRLNRAG